MQLGQCFSAISAVSPIVQEAARNESCAGDCARHNIINALELKGIADERKHNPTGKQFC